MCHLLADMSVPAHAHLDEHGLDPDSYEDYVGGAGDPYRTWNADNAGPAIILDGTTSQVLHFLLFTMQQQADHFGSNGPAGGNGNNDIGGDATPAEQEFLTGINLGSLGSPTTDAGPWSADNLNNIRDKTLPYAIRATAGLLYWFCVTTGIVPPITSATPDHDEDAASSARLLQNYPNPFNPTTTIAYVLRRSSDVRLSVLDVLGREVAVLVDGSREAGWHEVQFNASGLASGAYLCRFQSGNRVELRRLMLMR